MTYISESTSSDSTNNQITGSNSSTASELKEQFLQLFLAQLENQNPLDPMDSDTFTSQLCDLSLLEQAALTNEHLEKLDSAVTSSQAVSYIGKSMNVEVDTVNIAEDNTGEISFRISDEASEVYISIFDDDGNTIWSETLTELSSGSHTVALDDLSDDMAGGSYKFSVSAHDENGDSVSVTPYSSVDITGVVYEDEIPYLIAGDQYFSLDDVTEIYQS